MNAIEITIAKHINSIIVIVDSPDEHSAVFASNFDTCKVGGDIVNVKKELGLNIESVVAAITSDIETYHQSNKIYQRGADLTIAIQKKLNH